MKVCGVVVARLQGHSWSPNPSSGSKVNAGTIPVAPSPASMMLAGGKARRRLMPPGWDGGLDGKAVHRAKGSSRFAAVRRGGEVAGEYRRSVAQPR